MSKPYKVQRVFISFFGMTPLYNGSIISKILDCFESDEKLTPELWGLDERNIKSVYNRSDLLEVFKKNEPLSHHVYLQRTKQIKYKCVLRPGQKSSLFIELDKNITGVNWSKVYALADKLANVYQPDIGTVYFSPTFDLYSQDEKDINLRLMLTSAFLYPSDYYQVGPKGLGMRTYIGEHYLNAFGMDRIKDLPNPILKQEWGGLRLDLLEDFLSSEPDEIMLAWLEAMKKLKPAQVFADCETTSSGTFKFKHAANCKIRW